MPQPIKLAALALILAGSAGVALAQTPVQSAQSRSQCFRGDNVTNFAAVDRQTVNIRVGVRDIYQLKLMNDCGDIDFSQRIALESTGSGWICSAIEATVVAPTPTVPQRCPVTSLRKLTPAEVAALPRRQKP